MEKKTYTHAEWTAEGVKRFGDNVEGWRFICPSCGHVASVADWCDAGAPENAIAFSCIGRYTGSEKEVGDKAGGPCNYTGGGLFRLNPVVVYVGGKELNVFDFAEAQPC